MEEGEEATWEDALDVDDSDLPSLLRPLRPCPLTSLPSQAPLSLRPRSPPPTPAAAEQEAAPPPPHRIPGPAGAVQAAMHRRAAAAAVQDRGGLLVEGGGDDHLRASGGGAEEVDEDFSQNPWLCALDFLGGSGDASLPHPISSVKSLGSASRVPKLMGIVKSCKPNGLGDLFVTLKDPTGTIGASVHRKVLTEGNLGGDLSVGCVLILKQVAFFSPRRSIVYLNITLNNVDKFFGKDSGSPKRHTLPTLNAKHPPPGKSLVDEMEPVGRSCFLSQESQRCEVGSQGGLLAASRTADGGNMERHGCVQACDGEVVKSIYSKRTLDDMQIEHLSGSSMCTSKAVVGFRDVPRASLVRPGADNIYDEEIIQHSNLKGRVDNGTTETPGRRKGGMNAASDPSSLGWGMAPNEEADQVAVEQCGSSSNMVVGCGEDEGPTDYLLCKTSSTSLSNPMLSKPPERVTEPKSMISKVPLAQWTDEQLSELFCDYQDDTDFF